MVDITKYGFTPQNTGDETLNPRLSSIVDDQFVGGLFPTGRANVVTSPSDLEYVADLPKGVVRGLGSIGTNFASGVSAAFGAPETAAMFDDWTRHINQEGWFAPSSKEVAESFGSKLAQGLGSTAPFAVLGPLGWFGRAAATGLGMGAGAGEAYSRARDYGIDKISDEDYFTNIYGGAVLGASESLPWLKGGGAIINKLFKISRVVPKRAAPELARRVMRVAAQAGEEGVQELLQSLGMDALEKYTYNPELPIGEGALDDLFVGGAVGGLIQAMVEGRRSRQLAKAKKEFDDKVGPAKEELYGTPREPDAEFPFRTLPTIAESSAPKGDIGLAPTEVLKQNEDVDKYVNRIVANHSDSLQPGSFGVQPIARTGQPTIYRVVAPDNSYVGAAHTSRQRAEEVATALSMKTQNIQRRKETLTSKLDKMARDAVAKAGQQETAAMLEVAKATTTPLTATHAEVDAVDGKAVGKINLSRTRLGQHSRDIGDDFTMDDLKLAMTPEQIDRLLKNKYPALEDPTIEDLQRQLWQKGIKYEGSESFKTFMRRVTGTDDMNRLRRGQIGALMTEVEKLPDMGGNEIPVVPDVALRQEQYYDTLERLKGKEGNITLDQIATASGIDRAEREELKRLRNWMVEQGDMQKDGNHYRLAPPRQEQRKPHQIPFEHRLPYIEHRLKDYFSRVGLPEVGMRVARMLSNPRARGSYGAKLLDVGLFAHRGDARNFRDFMAGLRGTMDHETIHALRELDLITDAEWTYLLQQIYVLKNKDTGETFADWAERMYRNNSAMSPSDKQEEAVAEMFKMWKGRKLEVPAQTKGIFEKIWEFIRSLGKFFGEREYGSAREVFEAIDSGAIGARKRGEVRARATARTEVLRQAGLVAEQKAPAEMSSAPVEVEGQTARTEDFRFVRQPNVEDGTLPVAKVHASETEQADADREERRYSITDPSLQPHTKKAIYKAFNDLAEGQRGEPEQAMLKVQDALGGGPLNVVVEHVGDLTHTMTHLFRYGERGHALFEKIGAGQRDSKVERALKYLTHPYGFQRELDENILNNSKAKGVPANKFRADLYEALSKYADAHSKLTVWNAPQWHAREAAVAVGNRDWQTAINHLRQLREIASDKWKWEAAATDFDVDQDDNPIPFEVPRLGSPSPRRQGGFGFSKGQSDQRYSLEPGEPTYDAAVNSPEFKSWFEGSKVRDDRGFGNPRVVFHATGHNFDVFNTSGIGSHFGSYGAANDRSEAKGGDGMRVLPVFLSIKRPFPMRDAGPWSDSRAVLLSLSNRHILDKQPVPGWDKISELYDEAFLESGKYNEVGLGVTEDTPWRSSPENIQILERVKGVLEENGYDGIVYYNEVEDRGDFSFIAFRPDQIRSVFDFTKPKADQRHSLEDPDADRDWTDVEFGLYSKLGRYFTEPKTPKKWGNARRLGEFLRNPKSGFLDEARVTGLLEYVDRRGEGPITAAELAAYMEMYGNPLVVQEGLNADGLHDHYSEVAYGPAEGMGSYRTLLVSIGNNEHLLSEHFTDGTGARTMVRPIVDPEGKVTAYDVRVREIAAAIRQYYDPDTANAMLRDLADRLAKASYISHNLYLRQRDNPEDIARETDVFPESLLLTPFEKRALFGEDINDPENSQRFDIPYGSSSPTTVASRFYGESYPVRSTAHFPDVAEEYHVGWVRRTIHTTDKGHKAYNIQEMQSDVDNAVRSRLGKYTSEPYPLGVGEFYTPFRAKWVFPVTRIALIDAINSGAKYLTWTPPELQAYRWSRYPRADLGGNDVKFKMEGLVGDKWVVSYNDKDAAIAQGDDFYLIPDSFIREKFGDEAVDEVIDGVHDVARQVEDSLLVEFPEPDEATAAIEKAADYVKQELGKISITNIELLPMDGGVEIEIDTSKMNMKDSDGKERAIEAIKRAFRHSDLHQSRGGTSNGDAEFRRWRFDRQLTSYAPSTAIIMRITHESALGYEDFYNAVSEHRDHYENTLKEIAQTLAKSSYLVNRGSTSQSAALLNGIRGVVGANGQFGLYKLTLDQDLIDDKSKPTILSTLSSLGIRELGDSNQISFYIGSVKPAHEIIDDIIKNVVSARGIETGIHDGGFVAPDRDRRNYHFEKLMDELANHDPNFVKYGALYWKIIQNTLTKIVSSELGIPKSEIRFETITMPDLDGTLGSPDKMNFSKSLALEITPAIEKAAKDRRLQRFSLADEDTVTPPSRIPEISEGVADTQVGERALMTRYSMAKPSGDATIDRIYENVFAQRYPKTFGQRIMDVLNVPKWGAWFRYAAIDKLDPLGIIDHEWHKKFGLPNERDLYADMSAKAAGEMADRSMAMLAEMFKTGIPIYRNGMSIVERIVDPKTGKDLGGLVEIFKDVAAKDRWRAYAVYSAALRGTRLDQEGRERNMTKAEIQAGQAAGRAYPEIVEAHRKYQLWNEGLVRYLRDTGVISDEAARIFVQHADYHPFYREIDTGQPTPIHLISGRKVPGMFSGLANPVAPQKLKGGTEKLVNDPLEAIALNARAAIQAGVKNITMQRAMVKAQDLGLAKAVPESEKGSVSFYVNGKKTHFLVYDPLLYRALLSLDAVDPPWLKILNKPAHWLRQMVTKDPGFMLANMLRDTLSAYVTSGRNYIPVVSTFHEFANDLMRHGASDTLRRAGVVGGYDFVGDIKDASRTLRKQIGGWSKHPLYKFWDTLERFTEASDMATRAAVYKSALAKTGNEAQAIYEALNVINFSRRGANPLIRAITSMIPFLNARIQGLDVLYRAATGKGTGKGANINRKRAAAMFFARGMMLLGLSLYYYSEMSDDEEWKEAEPEIRDNNWIIPLRKLGWEGAPTILWPIPFEIGTLFKLLPERMLAYSQGKDEAIDLASAVKRSITSTFLFQPVPQFGLPAFEALTNYSFYRDRPVEPLYLSSMKPEDRFTSGTTYLARSLGKTLGLPPVRIDHVIRGYIGSLGVNALLMMDGIYRDVAGESVRPAMKIEDTPFIRRFFADSIPTGSITRFYDNAEQVRHVGRSFAAAARRGDPERLEELLRNHPQAVAFSRTYEGMRRQLAELRAMDRSIRDSKVMSAEMKRVMLDDIRRTMRSVIEGMSPINKEISRERGFSILGG